MTFEEQVSKITNMDVPNRATMFQLNFFILGKEPTHQAKLRRCVDELTAKKRQLDAMLLEVEDTKDRNELLQMESELIPASLVKEREVRIRMAERKIAANNKAIADLHDRVKNLQEEMLFFVQAFERLQQIEPMKPWDDIAVQSEYWNAKLAEDINYRLLMQLPIDIEVVKTVLALPVESPVKKQLLALLKNQTERLTKEPNG